MNEFAHRAESTVRRSLRRAQGRVLGAGVLPGAVSIALVVAGIALSVCIPSGSWLPSDPGRVVGPLAQVQGAIAAISLAVMVLIVEAVERREEIVDATYDVFLREAHVRWVISGVLVSTLGTAISFALTQVPSIGNQGNLVVFAAISIIITVLAILHFTLRALIVLRPSQYREFKRKAYLEQMQIGVTAKIKRINEIAASPTASIVSSPAIEMEAEQTMLQKLGDVAVASESTRPDRTEEDIEVLKSAFDHAAKMLMNSSYNNMPKDRRQDLELPLFTYTSRHFSSLWQASYASQVYENVRSIYRLHLHIAHLARDGSINDLRETVVANAISSYQSGMNWPEGVAHGVGLAWGVVRNHVWLSMLLHNAHPLVQADAALLRTISEGFQDSAASMVRDGHIAAFEQITAQISDLHDSLGHNRYGDGEFDYKINQPIDDLFHDVRLALAALAGLAILSQKGGYINNARAFVNRVHEILQNNQNAGESLERLLRVDGSALAQRWSWWDDRNDGSSLPRVRIMRPWQHLVLYFITASLIDGPDARLPRALGGIHRDVVDTLEQHWEIMCDVANIYGDVREIERERILSIIEAEKSADAHRRQDRIIATPVNAVQSDQYVQEVLQAYKQTEISSARVVASIFGGAGRVQILRSDDLDAPAESPFRLRGAFKGAFMQITETHYVADPSATRVVEEVEAKRRQMMIKLVVDQAGLVEAIPIDGDKLYTEISRVLADLQPQFPLFLITGRETGDLRRRLHRARSNIRRPASAALDRMPPDVEEALQTGEIMASPQIGEPALYVIDIARWGLMRRADIGDDPLRVEVHAISADRAGELLDTGRVNAGHLSREEAMRELQLQVVVEVTQRVDFVVEDPSAAVRIPLQVSISQEEVMAQDRVGFDSFTTQEGRNDA